jgi:hypothetical protein
MVMTPWDWPTEDKENPCFRPLDSSARGEPGLFTQLLERAVVEDGEDCGLAVLHRKIEDDLSMLSQSSTIGTLYSVPRRLNHSSAYSRSLVYPPSSDLSSREERTTYQLGRRTVVDSVLRAKRKRSSSCTSGYSDIHGPTKRGRSSQVMNDTSFELNAKADRIKTFFPNTGHSSNSDHTTTVQTTNAHFQPEAEVLKARIALLEGLKMTSSYAILSSTQSADELYGPRLGAETPRSLGRFVDQLDILLAGTGLKRRLPHIENLDYQAIADFLGTHGMLY